MEYSPDGVNIQLMCSSRVDPEHILWAFKEGADGVFIGGCHPGDCHYQTGNYKTMRKILLLKKILKDFGIKEERLRLEWVSASEGKKFVEVMNHFTHRLKQLKQGNL